MQYTLLHFGSFSPSHTQMNGLSLIELLISMVMGISLTAGVMQVYVGNTQIIRDQEARARMQENGRFAVSYLAQELRMAGFLGCTATIDKNSLNNALDDPPTSFQPNSGLQGWEASGTAPAVIANSVNDVATISTSGGSWTTSADAVLDSMMAVPNSDIVRVWNTSGVGATIHSIAPNGAVTIDNIGTVDIGDILLMSDCQRADWLQACNVHDTTGGAHVISLFSSDCEPGNIPSQRLRTLAGGEITRLHGTLFYVGKRGNLASNPPALFRRRLDQEAGFGSAEELVEGIESLQFLYGVDSTNNRAVDSYVNANLVQDWRRVISVRISVLVQSVEDNLLPSPAPYTFNGVTYDGGYGNGALPADTRLRRVFVSTVALRNRALGR